MPLSEAYARFAEAYGDPECCGRIHWNAERLEAWLRDQREWDGEWESLEPALLIKAASVAWDDGCP